MAVTVGGQIQNRMRCSTAHHRAMRWMQPFRAAAAMSASRIDQQAARFDAHTCDARGARDQRMNFLIIILSNFIINF